MIPLHDEFIKAMKNFGVDTSTLEFEHDHLSPKQKKIYKKYLRKNPTNLGINYLDLLFQDNKEVAFTLPYISADKTIPLDIYIKFVFFKFEVDPIQFICTDKNEKLYYFCACLDIREKQTWVISSIDIYDLYHILLYRNANFYINNYPEWVVVNDGENEIYKFVSGRDDLISIIDKDMLPDQNIKLEYFDYTAALKTFGLYNQFPSIDDLDEYELSDDNISDTLNVLGFRRN